MARSKKKEVREEAEILEVASGESESKARPAVQKLAKIQEQKEKKKEEDILTLLNQKKKMWEAYKEALLENLHKLVKEVELPKTYEWGVWYDGKGIRISIVDQYKIRHQRAFVPINDPKYDFEACHVLARWAQDLKDVLDVTPPSPIWTPKTN